MRESFGGCGLYQNKGLFQIRNLTKCKQTGVESLECSEQKNRFLYRAGGSPPPIPRHAPASETLQNSHCNKTEMKNMLKRGILFKVEKSIPLEKITDVAMSQGPLMRAFNLQRLSFETAGQSGPGALVSLIGIEDAAEFRESILSQKDKMSGDAKPVKANSEPSEGDLAELTASVKRIEVLLEKLVASK